MNKILGIVICILTPCIYAADNHNSSSPIATTQRLATILGSIAPYYLAKIGKQEVSYKVSVNNKTLTGDFRSEDTSSALALHQEFVHWKKTPEYTMLELLYTISEQSTNKRRSSLPCIPTERIAWLDYISTRGSLDDHFIDYVDYDPFSGSYAGNYDNGTIDITYGGTWQNAHG